MVFIAVIIIVEDVSPDGTSPYSATTLNSFLKDVNRAKRE